MNPDRDLNVSKDFERGLNDIFGYLLWQAELKEARDAAEAFADRLTWLTSAQREDAIRVYTADRLEMGREALLHIADRTAELRAEYQARYRKLQVRLVSASVIAMAVAVVWFSTTVTLL